MVEPLEGWYSDPYGRHEARWFSVGNPTGLVRDGASEGHDVVVEDEPYLRLPARIGAPLASMPASDLLRADDVNRTRYDPGEMRQAAFNAFTQNQPGAFPPASLFKARQGTPFFPRSQNEWFRLLAQIVGLALLAIGLLMPDYSQPLQRALSPASAAHALASDTSVTPTLCGTDSANGGGTGVEVGDDDAGKVVTVYLGQLVQIDSLGTATIASAGRSLCDDGDATGAVGTQTYGATRPGTDLVTLPHADGTSTVFEIAIPGPPPAPVAKLALIGSGIVISLLVVGGPIVRALWRRWLHGPSRRFRPRPGRGGTAGPYRLTGDMSA